MKTHFSEMSVQDLQESLADMSGQPLDEIKASFNEGRRQDIVGHLEKFKKSARNKRIAIVTGLAAAFSLGAGVATDKTAEAVLPTVILGFTSVASARSVGFWKNYGQTSLYGDLIDAKRESFERDIKERQKSWVPAEYHEELGLNS